MEGSSITGTCAGARRAVRGIVARCRNAHADARAVDDWRTHRRRVALLTIPPGIRLFVGTPVTPAKTPQWLRQVGAGPPAQKHTCSASSGQRGETRFASQRFAVRVAVWLSNPQSPRRHRYSSGCPNTATRWTDTRYSRRLARGGSASRPASADQPTTNPSTQPTLANARRRNVIRVARCSNETGQRG